MIVAGVAGFVLGGGLSSIAGVVSGRGGKAKDKAKPKGKGKGRKS
jgi:hypothetical protein